jgi:vitamin B12/bleomycin/antimicrobial peptide transport system ATP-binding/permease protein
VQSSLRWFVDNFSTIADWRATLLRVASFRRAVVDCDVMHDVASRIEIASGEPGSLTLDELEITSSAGTAMLAESHVEMKSGERVMVLSETGTGKTLLFRALAGLWPWGTGRIARPRGESTLYVPRASYFPPGTLREVLAYPSNVAGFTPDACVHSLERLGLERLIPMLEETRRWEGVLSDEEQHSLAFARALLHAPDWLVIDEALEALDAQALPRVREILTQDLKHAGILYIGRAGAHDLLFGRVVHLVNDPEGRCLPPRPRPHAVTSGSLG